MAVDLLAIARRTSVEGTHTVVPDDVLPDGVARLGPVPIDRLSLICSLPRRSMPAKDRAWPGRTRRMTGALLAVVVQETTPVDELVLGLFDQEVTAPGRRWPRRGGQPHQPDRLRRPFHRLGRGRPLGAGGDDRLRPRQTIAVAESLREVSRTEYDQLTEHVAACGRAATSSLRATPTPRRGRSTSNLTGSLCVDRAGSGSCCGTDLGGHAHGGHGRHPRRSSWGRRHWTPPSMWSTGRARCSRPSRSSSRVRSSSPQSCPTGSPRSRSGSPTPTATWIGAPCAPTVRAAPARGAPTTTTG